MLSESYSWMPSSKNEKLQRKQVLHINLWKMSMVWFSFYIPKPRNGRLWLELQSCVCNTPLHSSNYIKQFVTFLKTVALFVCEWVFLLSDLLAMTFPLTENKMSKICTNLIWFYLLKVQHLLYQELAMASLHYVAQSFILNTVQWIH